MPPPRHWPPATRHYLGIDFGTSAVRACLIDDAGRPVAEARAALPSPRRDGRAVEQDPGDWWRTLQEVLPRLGRHLQKVAAVALDGTSGTVLLCRPDGEPLGPALLYNDTRATAEARRVAAAAPADSPAASPAAALPKVLHLLHHLKPASPCLALSQADWLLGRLTGRFGIADEHNALKLGYDPLRRTWPDWLQRLALPAGLLPEVVPAGTLVGELAKDVARAFGLPAATRAVAGTTDSTAGAIATGIEGPGEAVTSLGSTLVVKILSEAPLFSREHGVYSHRLGDLWLAGGASNSGGAVLRQFFTDARLDELSRRIRPARASCLDYMPLPATGERFPVNDPQLEPRLSPRPRDDVRFLHGLLESIARIERRGYRLLGSMGAGWPRRVLTVGGGARNPAWTQIRARLLRTEVTAATQSEAAYGAALLARNSVHNKKGVRREG